MTVLTTLTKLIAFRALMFIVAAGLRPACSAASPGPDRASCADTRVLIEQAKGYMAAALTLTMEAAFEVLRGYSGSQNMNIHDVAASVLAGTLLADNGTLRHVEAA